MAIRYWVGGSGTWDASSTTHWSTSSGGASGASAPVAIDTVYVDANSGTSFTITLGANISISDLFITITATSATLSLNGYNLTTSNTCTFSGYAVVNVGSGTLAVVSVTQSGTNSNISVNTGAITCTGTYTFSGGTLNLNTGSITCSTWNSPSSTRTINWNTNGTIYVTGTTLSHISTNLTTTNPPGNFVHTGTSLTASINNTFTESTAPNLSMTGSNISSTVIIVKNLVLNGTGTVNCASTIYGDLTVSSGISGNNQWTMAATSGTKTITTNNASLTFVSLVIDGPGATFNLNGNWNSNTNVNFKGGTFNANSYNITCFQLSISGSTTKVVNMGSGTWNLNYPLWATFGANSTVNPQTSTINLAGSATYPTGTFSGQGLTYYNLNVVYGTVTITGSNTFNNISSTATTATTLKFTAGTTQTVSNFTASGTAGNLLTLQSTTSGSKWYLSKSSGTVSVGYLSISDCTVNPGANWYAGLNSTNGGNNLGWYFSDPYVVAGQFLDVISFSDE
jgi:hypothetical protein